jgi:hypothetical protein
VFVNLSAAIAEVSEGIFRSIGVGISLSMLGSLLGIIGGFLKVPGQSGVVEGTPRPMEGIMKSNRALTIVIIVAIVMALDAVTYLLLPSYLESLLYAHKFLFIFNSVSMHRISIFSGDNFSVFYV